MAFPTTSVLDTGDRANEGPPPSASWEYNYGNPGAADDDGLKIVSNQIASNGTAGNYANSYWTTSYGPDCEVYATVSTLPETGEELGLEARITSPSTGGGVNATTDSYQVGWIQQGSNNLYISRLDNSVYTQLGAIQSVTNLSAGNKFGFELIGSTLQAYRHNGSSWAAWGTSRTDSTYSAAGKIGLTLQGTTVRLDDFGGGTISGSAPLFRGS
jgi:hypothetical protein